MKSINRIEIGDSVKAFINDQIVISGVVDWAPVATGDNWIILDHQGDIPIYIQNYNYIILTGKQPQAGE